MLQKRWGGCQGQYLCPSGRHWPRTLFLFGTSEEGACAPPIHYGDITRTACYKPYMRLLDGENAYYAV